MAGCPFDLLVCHQTDGRLERFEGGANPLGFMEGCENDLEHSDIICIKFSVYLVSFSVATASTYTFLLSC